MTTSWNRNAFCAHGPLWVTGWFPSQTASNAERWCFFDVKLLNKAFSGRWSWTMLTLMRYLPNAATTFKTTFASHVFMRWPWFILTHWGRYTKWRRFRRRHIQYIFLNENVWISLKISLRFVPKRSNWNIPALVQIMAWCRIGDQASHYLNQWRLDYWRIYAPFGLNQLTWIAPWFRNQNGYFQSSKFAISLMIYVVYIKQSLQTCMQFILRGVNHSSAIIIYSCILKWWNFSTKT